VKSMILTTIVLVAVGALLTLVGCGSRTTSIALEAADRQAAQNQELARLDREHAAARKELVNLHQQVQTERQFLATGWHDLQAERNTVIQERRTESLVGQLIPVLLLAIAALFVWRMTNRWLDYRTAPTLIEQRSESMTSAPLPAQDELPRHDAFLPLTLGDPDESPRDDHDPGA
jgi:hypothetical protein